jgi:hypothetical protein
MEECNLSLQEALKLNTELLGGPQQRGDAFAGWEEVAARFLKTHEGRRRAGLAPAMAAA